jgi:hypothetical protein
MTFIAGDNWEAVPAHRPTRTTEASSSLRRVMRYSVLWHNHNALGSDEQRDSIDTKVGDQGL